MQVSSKQAAEQFLQRCEDELEALNVKNIERRGDRLEFSGKGFRRLTWWTLQAPLFARGSFELEKGARTTVTYSLSFRGNLVAVAAVIGVVICLQLIPGLGADVDPWIFAGLFGVSYPVSFAWAATKFERLVEQVASGVS